MNGLGKLVKDGMEVIGSFFMDHFGEKATADSLRGNR
jgi:hypothetical protein